MARRFRVSAKKNINIPRVIAKTTAVVIALYVGNEIINQVGSIMNLSTGPFNQGFKLIGWSVGTNANTNGTAGCFNGCQVLDTTCSASAVGNCITNVNGAGVLSVIGVVGVASIVLEFITFNLY